MKNLSTGARVILKSQFDYEIEKVLYIIYIPTNNAYIPINNAYI